MNAFRISDVLTATRAILASGDPRRLCSGVNTDTRSLRPGELFFALRGPSHDGNRFAREASEKGAAGIVLCAEIGHVPAEAALVSRDIPVLLHPDPRAMLADLARWHRARIPARVIGVTGSCGKTTTKNILVELLGSRMTTIGSPNSFNNDIGVPLTLFLADDATEALVVEIGTNGPGEIAHLASIAKPDAGIVTTVGAAHLEGLGSIDGVAIEKGALVEAIPEDGFCVLNADNPWTRSMRRRARCRVLTFSLEGEGDLDARDVWFHPGGTTFRLEGREITSPLLGLHNVQNLLAALAACRGLGLEIEEVLPAVSRLRAGRGRLDRIQCGRYTLIDDSYNANPESARASVRTLAGLHGHRRRVLVLGDMLELGPLAPELHHEIGVEAARSGIDLLVLVGELTRATAAGALSEGLPADRVIHLADTEEAIARVPRVLDTGDVVLVKGSRRTGLDRLVKELVERELAATGNAA
ncbi:MAG: UDP-N-acetylmuramoyl-tripeptide--D-alanyl-D-alanine ligase [Planctomycetota bacterium]|nr:UDP-N-acetylmuramoyl-tripeptide--D-alanyl-D-alanine ligase [Planctomycetota bacterium]